MYKEYHQLQYINQTTNIDLNKQMDIQNDKISTQKSILYQIQPVIDKEAQQLSLISQYLQFQNESRKNMIQLAEVKGYQVGSSQVSLISMKDDLKNDELQANKSKNRSIFHNFQKHLVTTLKRGVKIKKFQSKHEAIPSKAYQMWNIFVKQNNYTKKLLLFLFGTTNQSNLFNNSSFKQFVSKNSLQDIQNAQKYLRTQTVKQCRKILDKKFENRHINKCRQFELYFRSFIEEIERGPLNRRLPKFCKIKLMEGVNKQQK